MSTAISRGYVFPNARQRQLIEQLESAGEHVVVTVADVFDSSASPSAAAAAELADAVAASAALLCMNELAVYVLGLLDDTGDVGFARELLSTVTKSDMDMFLGRADVPRLPSSTLRLGDGAAMPREPPFVIKPDFGFASQLVMRITDHADWQAFLTAARDDSLWPLRRRYAESLFRSQPDLLDLFVVQPDESAARFLSVPFAFCRGQATAFVTEGAWSVASAATSFSWRGFRAPTTLPHDALAALELELAAIGRTAACRPGVYEAEMLWTPEQHWFLEFSPRQTGGLVPDLVIHAYGVDIELLALQLFRGDQPDIAVHPAANAFLGRRATGSSSPPSDADELVVAVERDSAGTTVRDEIWCLAAEN